MKSATAQTLAILASGQWYKAELYDIVLANSAGTLRWTSYDLPLTVGGNLYSPDVIIRRGNVRQERGIKVQTMELTVLPQLDAPTPVTVSGLSLPAALRRGVFDGAVVTMYKVFMSSPTDTSAGAVQWFSGRVNEVSPGRWSSRMTIQSHLELLNIPMPRNVIQTGCLHSLFDTGCGLSKASFTSTATCTGSSSTTTFTYSGLAQATGYFDLGVITFTSGVNNGVSRTVKSYASGTIVVINPFPSAPANGDTFSIVPGCDKLQATCSSKFSNIARFKGFPYVPVPETLYGGSAASPSSAGAIGNSVVVGSPTAANNGGRTYVS